MPGSIGNAEDRPPGFEDYAQRRQPFTRCTFRGASKVHWVRPELVVEVTYLTWTEDNLLRQVSYQGQREDKAARQVVRLGPRR